MKIKKINNNKILIFFLFAHIIVWTLVPSISNTNLPLDTIEALAWGGNLDWGYSKHPPFSAWSVEIFYRIFGNQDWAYYFLSQLFVITAFFVIFKFSEDFFKNKIFSLISVLLLEGIYFYNFTTPEFNVNVCQLPFWSLTVYYCWKGINQNNITNWLLFGLFAACGVLSKYLFVYLLVAIVIFFIYLINKKKFNSKCLVSLISFFVILSPHLIWLFDNNYVTFNYAFKRTGLEATQFLDHIYNPVIFLGKQFGILIPFFLMFLFATSKFKTKFNFKDKKFLFLLIINIVPILLIFLTSLLTGAKLRTMWMTPFYLFMGVFFVYIFHKSFALYKLKYFFSIFLMLFIFSPATYFYVSATQNDKRTDYPGKEISQAVQKKWENNFSNKISIVGGNEWHAGNLSYHLKSRPLWDNIFETGEVTSPKNNQDGFVLIADEDILSKICNGIFLKIEGQGICMIGKKK